MGEPVRVSVFRLNGEEVTVKVNSSWEVWQLKECVRKKCRVPEYEQYFAHQSTKLRSADKLSAILSTCKGNNLAVSLVRCPRPPCFSKSEASELWEAFLAFSPDKGDTIDGARVSRVARFSDVFEESELDANVLDVPESVTFPDLLDILASVKVTKDSLSVPKPTDDALQMYNMVDLGTASVRRIAKKVEGTHETSDESSDDNDSASDGSDDSCENDA
eukprot:TRINITY_DN19572_c0_g5_i1.p1 TRINITY_DN19572_c0_g5~~TRINITY_DN19572_c0_g5_i1.p1  ORF type:complete len:218 (+),score=38.40 TRINITY_DN19572_c0_g5_i1:96-749(+)